MQPKGGLLDIRHMGEPGSHEAHLLDGALHP
jgi:hypothetical protein